MGTAERKEREKLQRRQEIIESAEKIFFSKGFDNSTMDDIASEAELSKGTLYIYFKSKEELYKVFVHQAVEKMNELFIEFASKEKYGIEKVRAIGKAYMKFYFDYPNHYKALMYDEAQTFDLENIENNETLKIKMETNNILIDTIKEGINDGSIRKDLDPVKTSLILWGESLGVLQLVTVKGEILCNQMKCSTEDLISYFFEFTYHALKP